MKKEDLKVWEVVFIANVSSLVSVKHIIFETDREWHRCVVIVWDRESRINKISPCIDSFVIFENEVESRVLSLDEYELRKQARKKERIESLYKSIKYLEND